MEKNLEKTSVVNTSTTLVNMENYAVDFEGGKISSAGDGCLGVVSLGHAANLASEVVVRGLYEVYVDGATSSISIGDPLTAGGGGSAGEMTKATVGTHAIRAYANEAATTHTKIEAWFI